MPRSPWLLPTALALLLAAPAPAHFFFLRIVPAEGGGRVAEAYFSDQADAGDASFVDKIAHTELWAQSRPGAFVPLKVVKGEKMLTAPLPASGPLAVVGRCTYGVLPRKTPFLLRHFPKAVAGDPAEVDKLRTCDRVPLEIVGRSTGKEVRFQVLRDGKPLPKATLEILTDKLGGVPVECDAEGRAAWTPPQAGWYMAYVAHFYKEAGNYRGTPYAEVRDFATLSFTWPPAAKR